MSRWLSQLSYGRTRSRVNTMTPVLWLRDHFTPIGPFVQRPYGRRNRTTRDRKNRRRRIPVNIDTPLPLLSGELQHDSVRCPPRVGLSVSCCTKTSASALAVYFQSEEYFEYGAAMRRRVVVDARDERVCWFRQQVVALWKRKVQDCRDTAGRPIEVARSGWHHGPPAVLPATWSASAGQRSRPPLWCDTRWKFVCIVPFSGL